MPKFDRQVKRQRNQIEEKDRMAKMYNQGFKDGASLQLENDIQKMLDIVAKLETAEGIGQKTAEKVRMFFLEELGQGEQ